MNKLPKLITECFSRVMAINCKQVLQSVWAFGNYFFNGVFIWLF